MRLRNLIAYFVVTFALMLGGLLHATPFDTNLDLSVGAIDVAAQVDGTVITVVAFQEVSPQSTAEIMELSYLDNYLQDSISFYPVPVSRQLASRPAGDYIDIASDQAMVIHNALGQTMNRFTPEVTPTGIAEGFDAFEYDADNKLAIALPTATFNRSSRLPESVARA